MADTGDVVTEAQAAMLVEATKLVEASRNEQALIRAAEGEAAAVRLESEARADLSRLTAALQEAEERRRQAEARAEQLSAQLAATSRATGTPTRPSPHDASPHGPLQTPPPAAWCDEPFDANAISADLVAPAIRLAAEGPWSFLVQVSCGKTHYSMLKRYSEFRLM